MKGQSPELMQRLIREKLRLQPGVARLADCARQKNIKIVVLSGGFHPIVDVVAQMIGADACRANRLSVSDGMLDGGLIGSILNAQAKARFVDAFLLQWGLERQQSIAVGDGANDLAMMAIAGLSACYRAKPVVAAQAALSFRALAAQANCWEALIVFAAALLFAMQHEVDANHRDALCISFIGARLLYLWAYYVDKATLRSLVWLIGYGSALGLIGLTIS
ncbi:MAG: HAD family hydrolase [Betaproteobacteria bacterium]|nr:HAD family hydrolase [Betaproteobacteria bacterium]